eukprot:1157107-Amphidinium_carterae.1
MSSNFCQNETRVRLSSDMSHGSIFMGNTCYTLLHKLGQGNALSVTATQPLRPPSSMPRFCPKLVEMLSSRWELI